MKIESVDLFYLRMPEVLDIGDGSQDALLVRVRAGEWTGWGECEASPLTSIASFVAPMSHSACKPLAASVLGAKLDDPEDVRAIHRAVRENSFDLLQADHTLSGVDIALWDLLGRRLGEPVYRLLGFERAYPKLPYASILFGETPEETGARAAGLRAQGFRAAKFGWGPFGRRSLAEDEAQLRAARSGIGPEADLLVDAGTVWGADVEAAAARLPALAEVGARWLEEPFPGDELAAYADLSRREPRTALAGGEGCNRASHARHMIDAAGIGYVQIDAGRVGGITDAHRVAAYAEPRGVQFVNHTFTSSLALAASIHPFAGLERHDLCEFPAAPKPLARDLATRLEPGPDGLLRLPEAPGVGVEVDLDVAARYLVETEIRAGGEILFRSDARTLRG